MRFLIGLIFLSLSVHASYYQTTCSNSNATLLTANGHSQNFVKVGYRNYVTGEINTDFMELEFEDINLNYTQDIVINRTSESNCTPRGGSGMGSWETIKVQKLTIYKKDGTSFPKDTTNLSSDLKTVSDYVICKTNGNSRIVCPETRE